jgi:protein-L-isoaspartate(D-aspartate) O-methyltransferase
VLEIGAGTGYNAALIAHILGDQEAVVTVDIDEEIVERARSSLAAAGYGAVRVICADGALGVAEHAPYDRIIVTVGAWDIAPQWLGQLAPGGRIVLPLSVRGIQLSMALEREGDHWGSRSAWRCGFIRMAGSLAGPESFVPLGPQPGLHAYTEDGRPLDAGELYAALSGEVTDVPTDLAAADTGELGDLDLWLTITEPGLTRLTLAGVQAQRARQAPLMPLGGLATTGAAAADAGIAAVVPARAPRPAALQEATGLRGRPAALGAVVRGFGPGGAELARHLARQVLAWQEQGRPGAADLCLDAYLREAEPGAGGPAVPAVPAGPATGQVVLERRYVRLVLGWSAT